MRTNLSRRLKRLERWNVQLRNQAILFLIIALTFQLISTMLMEAEYELRFVMLFYNMGIGCIFISIYLWFTKLRVILQRKYLLTNHQ